MLTAMDSTGPASDPRLPAGYRLREFADSDREPIVAERNVHLPPMQHGTADEWREWERMDPPKDELRVTLVAPDGSVAGGSTVGPRRMGDSGDGTLSGQVQVFRAHARKGIGRALLELIESEAKRRNAPRILSAVSAAIPGALDWAVKRGYVEIGRRIESYVDVQTFDATPFRDLVTRVKGSGIRLLTFAERVDGLDDAGREAFWRGLWEAEGPVWDDVPWAAPAPHWPYERFHRLVVESGKTLMEASILALDGERIAGFTSTIKQQDKGFTAMTGTAREYRGRQIALAMKVAMLERARAAGLSAMLTTNDEPNKAMRGINAKLGYVMLPARVELAKTL